MNRLQKEKEVEFLADSFQKSKSFVLANYRGLKVQQITDLRAKLYKAKSSIKVIKNRLAKIALAKAKIEGLDEFLTGPVAVAWSREDEIAPAKVLVDFAKANEKLEIKGGCLAGKFINLNFVKSLAALPSREALIAKMLGSMLAPATNFVGVLSALPRQLVTVISAIKDKKN